MKENHHLQEKIDNYLLDLLSEEEKIAFEQQISENEELRQEVELVRQISEAFILKGEQKALNEMQNISSKEDLRNYIRNAEKKYHSKNKVKQLSIYISTAAAVILILIYIGFQPKYPTDELFYDYYKPNDYIPTAIRGGNDELIEKQTQQLYDAICLMEKQPTTAVIDSLTHFSTSFKNDFLRESAQWNLALTYLKIGQRSKAKEALLEINKAGSIYANEAFNLLESIDKRRWF